MKKYVNSKIKILLSSSLNNIVLAKKCEEITCNGTDKIYEIFFNVPVPLEPYKIYNIAHYSDGQNNFCGYDGKTVIEENGVEIKLSRGLPINKSIDSLTSGSIA